MKAKELMIGDWVKSRGKIEQVTSVYGGYICTDSFEDSHEDYFEPIPLTPEILEKNGFKFEYGAAWNLYRFSVPWFVLYKKEYGLMLNIGQIEIPISFVHRLQHALRLCGIEKEIEL